MPLYDLALPNIEGLKSVLASDSLKQTEDEYQRLKKKRKGRVPPWFSLFGGPGSLEQLADVLGRFPEYSFLYRRWSAEVHGRTFQSRIVGHESGHTAFSHIRDPRQLAERAFWATEFALCATRLVVTKYRPGEYLGTWYSEEAQPSLQRLQALSTNEKLAALAD